jgi:ATP-dependent RNA helicase DeaD
MAIAMLYNALNLIKEHILLFEELGLRSSSLKAVTSLGFTEPTEIQEKSIPLLLEDHIDFIGQAQTGTGKTAAFTLPLLERIDTDSKDIQSIIISPTRELANQIAVEIEKLSQFEPVRTTCVYGGTPIGGQIRELKNKKPSIVVGTPGRIIDLIDRGKLKIEQCHTVILDEADEMLDMGFFDDIQLILSRVENKKIWMFSATMPKPILKLINEHFCDPQLVKVTKRVLTSDSITQQFCVVSPRNRTEALCRILDYTNDMYAIIFTRTKLGAQGLVDELNMRGFPSDALHGDMSQDQRDLNMKKFKQKKINLLVCTDVAARGIDVDNLTHVINFELPQDNEAYVHRIGRTGRGGSKGIALSIIDQGETRRLRDIERITKAKIELVTLPTLVQIRENLIAKAIGEFSKAIDNFDEKCTSYQMFHEEFGEMSSDELLRGVYSMISEQSLKRYKNARSIDVEPRKSRAASSSDKSSGRGGQRGFSRMKINLGRQDDLDVGGMIRIISRNTQIRGGEIGKIILQDNFSYFDVPERHANSLKKLNGLSFKRKTVVIEPSSFESGNSRRRPRRGGSGGSRSSRSQQRRY